jgi:hypothetical protein
VTAVLLFHADPSMLPRYKAALPHGARLSLVLSHGSQFSGGYDEHTGFASKYPTLPDLLRAFDKEWIEGEPVVLIGFSAGCWALRAYLRNPDDRARVRIALFLDGMHSDGSDKQAEVGPIQGAIDFGGDVWRALGYKALIVSHTQIVPPGYASTRATADALLGAMQIPRPSRSTDFGIGGVYVRAFPGGTAPDHAHQLQVVGPDLIREIVTPTLAGKPPAFDYGPAGYPAGPVDAIGPTVDRPMADPTAPTDPAPAGPEVPVVVVPPPAPISVLAGPQRLPADLTPATALQVGQALIDVWPRVVGSPLPSLDPIRLLLSQWALETGRGKSMHAWNFGNAKASASMDHCFFPCDEVMTQAQADAAVQSAPPREDGQGPSAILKAKSVKTGVVSVIVNFYPPHPVCRFRAFRTIDEGAADYLGLLRRRFSQSWPALLAGDPVQFCKDLQAQGYFTAALGPYTAGVVSLYNEFAKLPLVLPES